MTTKCLWYHEDNDNGINFSTNKQPWKELFEGIKFNLGFDTYPNKGKYGDYRGCFICFFISLRKALISVKER